MNSIQSLESRRLFNFGSFDTTFGENGIAPDSGNSLTQINVARIYEQSDGRIVTAGDVLSDWALHRYLADGSIDSGFGDDGFVQLQIEGNPVTADFVAEAPDGGLFISGQGHPQGAQFNITDTMLLAKLKADGTVDTSFPAGGSNVGMPGYFLLERATSFAPQDQPLRVLASGKLLVVSGLDSSDVVVHRYNPDGSLDRSFNKTGKLAIDLSDLPTDPVQPASGTAFTRRQRVAVQTLTETPDGSVVLTGYYIYARGTVNNDDDKPYVAVELPYFMRVSAGGTVVDRAHFELDPKKVKASRYTGLNFAPQQIESAPDGALYMTDGVQVVKLRSDFSLDGSFSTDGVAVATAHSTDPNIGDYTPNLRQFKVQSDGKVVAVASTPHFSTDALLARFNLDGSTDEVVPLDLPANNSAVLTSLALSRDGTIVASFPNLPTRVFRDDSPAGRFEGGSLREARTGPYKFSVVWRDEDGIDIDSLDNSDLKVLGPHGFDFIARLISKTLMDDGSVLARYRTGPPDSLQWSSFDNGRYTVRLLSNRVRDQAGHFAAARNLGAFTVRIG